MQTEQSIVLPDLDAWRRFVAANRDAIIEEYGDIKTALKHAIDGGLTLGGGAFPLYVITFEM